MYRQAFAGGGQTNLSSPLEFLGGLESVNCESKWQSCSCFTKGGKIGSLPCKGGGTNVPEGLRKFTLSRIAKFTKFIKQFNPLTKREGKESSHPELVSGTQYKKSPLPPFRKRGLRLCLPCKGGGTNVPEGLLTKKKAAFTLAEVLITLGIIGIVAAMTLPSLIADYKKKEIPVRLKKFSSTMQNALSLAVLDYGDMNTWVYPIEQGDADSTSAFVDKYLFPYLTGIRKCEAGDNECKQFAKVLGAGSDRMPIYIFSDGSCFGLVAGDSGTSGAQLHITYDYNCLGKPNEYDKDIFSFYIKAKNAGTGSYKFIPGNFPVLNANSREDLLDLCKNHEDAHMHGICSALIEYDGWEIKDDYPWL